MTRVLLVDDHALIRRGMRDALRESGLEVAGEAASYDELGPLLRELSFDVLLLDINLPRVSGLEILELHRTLPSPPRTLVVSMYPEDQYAVKVLRAGAWGYVSKSADTAALVDAIRTVARGRKYISPSIASLLAEQLSAPVQHLPHERLSEREQQLLQMLALGRRLPEIAQQLDLPAKTVSVYRARLLEKMKLSSNAELAHYASRHNLLPATGSQLAPG